MLGSEHGGSEKQDVVKLYVYYGRPMTYVRGGTVGVHLKSGGQF